MLNPKSFELSKTTKVGKNYDHFTKMLRFWFFLDPLSILQISQRGKSFDSLGNDIRDQQHLISRMMYKKREFFFYCKLALGAPYYLQKIIYWTVKSNTM